MGIISRFILLLSVVSSFASFAKEAPFLYTNPIEISADIIPRRHGVGEDDARTLRFVKWVALNDRARIGLTNDGQVFGAVEVVKTDESGQPIRKNFAYLLSGRRTITAIYIDDDERLRATDSNDLPLIFDDQKWQEKPLRSILKQSGRNLADELSAFTALYIVSKNIALENWDLPMAPTLILGGMAATGIGFLEIWKAVVRFGDLNRFPDGFRIISSDDIVRAPGEVPHQKLYDRTCELEMIPWPVDQSTWKP